jgi:hypothetical protein
MTMITRVTVTMATCTTTKMRVTGFIPLPTGPAALNCRCLAVQDVLAVVLI